MTIEFRCTQCDKLLRVPAGTEGKKAKCPQCGNVLNIPDAVSSGMAETTYHAEPPPPPQRPPSDNPFQSPMAAEMRDTTPVGGLRRGFNPTRIDLGDVMAKAWSIYKANLWQIVLGSFVILVLSAAIGGGVAYALQDSTILERQLANLVTNLPSIWLSLGLFTYLLKIARGDVAVFSDLFSGGPYMLRAIGVFLLTYLAVIGGFILLIIPGIIFALMFSQAFCVLIDCNVGVMDSMKMSMAATRGNKLTLFALLLVMMPITLLVTVFTCGIGYFFVVPFGSLLYIVTYLMMTGQSTAADEPV